LDLDASFEDLGDDEQDNAHEQEDVCAAKVIVHFGEGEVFFWEPACITDTGPGQNAGERLGVCGIGVLCFGGHNGAFLVMNPNIDKNLLFFNKFGEAAGKVAGFA
jgi:hypothetical protein